VQLFLHFEAINSSHPNIEDGMFHSVLLSVREQCLRIVECPGRETIRVEQLLKRAKYRGVIISPYRRKRGGLLGGDAGEWLGLGHRGADSISR
jgi:hypothetical protein